MDQIESETRRCPACVTLKSPAEFTNGKSKCRPCAANYAREYRARNPERVREWTRSSYRTHAVANRSKSNAKEKRRRTEDPVGAMLIRARVRAKVRGIEFTLTRADIVIPEFCPVLGFRLDPIGAHSDRVPSLDRFDSTKGYEPGNVHVISYRANTIKNDGTVTELEKIAAWMRAESRQALSYPRLVPWPSHLTKTKTYLVEAMRIMRLHGKMKCEPTPGTADGSMRITIVIDVPPPAVAASSRAVKRDADDKRR